MLEYDMFEASLISNKENKLSKLSLIENIWRKVAGYEERELIILMKSFGSFGWIKVLDSFIK